MPRCFVIQPFDNGGPFDARYDDTIAPAIREAGIEPYRVDRDHSVSIPIESIEKTIQDSDYCLADITPDNPNVWYEVGFAFACGREVVLICSQERTVFPFDVRHRNIIRYRTQSPRDFDKLATEVTERLLAYKARTKTIADLSPMKETEGLSPHEITALLLLMSARLDPNRGSLPEEIKNDMRKRGFNEAGTVLAVEKVIRKGFVEEALDYNDWNHEQFSVYRVTEKGLDWCLANQGKFNLEYEPPKPPPQPPHGGFSPPVRRPKPAPEPSKEDDDDIPF
jgi:nucleoside 2-deoxyribosyltransferase